VLVRRFLSGREVRGARDVHTAIFLWTDERGVEQYLVLGEEGRIKELFIFGALCWPINPWSRPVASAIEMILGSHPLLSLEERARRVEESLMGAALLSGTFGPSELLPRLPGDESYQVVTDNTGLFDRERNLVGLTNSVAMLDGAEGKMVGTNGAGSQKELLMYYGVEVLWGADVREELFEAIRGGPYGEIWLKMAKGMRAVRNGETVDLSD
jgi:hypothetical protein